MTRSEQVEFLIAYLLNEMPEYRRQAAQTQGDAARRRLLRGLMNLCPPMPLDPAFLAVQDALLSAEREERGVVQSVDLPKTDDPRISLWQGDITRLAADAIVNAANAELLGCFVPCHQCIDNAIHSAAGLQLRNACNEQMKRQGHAEATGSAKITDGYNLPAKYVLHTVGPIVQDAPTREDCHMLASCYRACMALAMERGLASVVFCCISTGVFHFPNRAAASIAVETAQSALNETKSNMQVIFNVYKDADLSIYRELLYGNGAVATSAF